MGLTIKRIIATTAAAAALVGWCTACGQDTHSTATPDSTITASPEASLSHQSHKTPSASASPTESTSPSPTESAKASITPEATPTPTPDSQDSTRIGNTYSNVRYAYAVDIPDGYEWQREADNGDGRVFTNAATDVTIRAYGSHNMNCPSDCTGPSSPEQVEAQLKQNHTVSYSTVSGDVVVATWKDGDTITYQRNLVDDDAVCTIEFEYPTASSDAGDEAIAQVATTLRRTQRVG